MANDLVKGNRFWPKVWSDTRAGLPSKIVLAIGSALVAATWTALKVYAAETQLGLPVAISAGLVVFASLVSAFNNLREIDNAAERKRAANRTPAQIERQIMDWLIRYQFSVQKVPSSHPETEFRLNINDGRGMSLSVAKTPDTPWVVISGTIQIREDHRPIIARRTPFFRLDVGTQLLPQDIEYEINPAGYDSAVTDVRVFRRVPFDESMTDLEFLRIAMLVRSGLGLVDIMVVRLVREAQQIENRP